MDNTETETTELSQKEKNEQMRKVYNFRNKSEKLSWIRKKKRIEKLIDDLKPFEEEILRIIEQKQPIIDKINKIRQDMKKDCVHPRDHLIHEGTHILCKFCNTKIKINTPNNE